MIWIFTLATIINVSLSTIRSLCTIKGGKLLSATTNAICYGFYPLIVMLTARGTVEIWVNMIITAIVNFVCVYIIKAIEKKLQKDKLWLVKCTIPKEQSELFKLMLNNAEISNSYIDIQKYYVFDTYCGTQDETARVLQLVKECNGKAFATENKIQ